MAIQQIEKTSVSVLEDLKITWETKRWFILSWDVRLKTESSGKELHIMTEEHYDKIFLNGKKIN